ncbi:MAG: ATP synthase F1 subunit gamma [Planctomycetota bacterium]
MANTRILLRRRKSIRNTRKITKTMEKVATAKLAKAQSAAVAARPYTTKLKEIIGQVAAASGEIKHPLLEAHPEPKNAVLILLTSDRGLCGAFNSNLVREARALIAELQAKGRRLEFIVQGKKGIGAFKYLNLPMAERLAGISDKPTFARADEIAAKLLRAYEERKLDEVYLVYATFKSATSQVPKHETLLPLAGLRGAENTAGVKAGADARAAKAPGAGFLFHPDPKTILAQVLPLVVKMALFTAMLENAASEHAARRVAMKNATDNADEMIKLLTRQYNRARQGKITQEIAEIVGGTNAL